MRTTFKIFIAFLIFTLILWIGGYGIFLYQINVQKPQMPKAKTDAIVVLTGGNYRILTGLELWDQGLAPELFITGVDKNVGRQQILNHWNKDNERLPFCCLTLGYEATNTVENALETKEWIELNYISSIRLVTSKYHMPRSYLELHSQIPDIEIIRHPVQYTDHKVDEYRYWEETFLEYHKIIVRFVQIYILNW